MYFGPPKTLAPRSPGLAKGELGHGVADAALDALGAERDLVVALAFAPLLRAVGVADGHAHDRDRRVHTAEGRDAGDSPAGADDHPAADLLAQDAVWRADVAAAFRRDRRGLQPEPVLADGARSLVHDPVVGLAAPFERQIEARELELDPDHVGPEHAEALLQELLPGLVPFEDDDRPLVAHRARW